MKNSIWKDEKENFISLCTMNKVAISSKPRLFCRRTAHWIIIQGGEKKVVHIMQTVDTCMQYWRQKIMKIRGQSLSSRFFSLIILITDCPPIQCHRTLANLDPAALFWRNSLWLWIAVEWVCTCVLAEAEDSGDVVFLKYTSMKKYTSEHYTSMQVCASTQMHQEREHVQIHKWTLKYAEEQSLWLARPSFCCLVTGRPSSS